MKLKQYRIKVMLQGGAELQILTFLGDSIDEAKKKAAEKGYQILSLNNEIEEIAYGKNTKPLFYSKNIKKKDVLLFFELLGNLQKLPVIKQIEILRKQSSKYIMKEFFDDMLLNINKGKPLYQIIGLPRWEKYFSHNQLKLIQVGETTGNLPQTLKNLAEEQRNELKTRAAIIIAMIYPLTIIFAIIVCAAVCFLFILPQLESLVGDMEKPPLAQLLFSVKDFIENTGVYFIIAMFFFSLFLKVSIRTDAGKYIFHKVLLKIPAIKSLVKARAEMQISKILEFSSTALMTPKEKMDLLVNGIDNLVYRQHFIDNEDKIVKGSQFYKIFIYDHLFSAKMQGYIETGDINKNLDELMNLHYYTTLETINSHLKAITTLISFLVLITLAGGVLVFAGGIFQLVIGLTKGIL